MTRKMLQSCIFSLSCSTEFDALESIESVSRSHFGFFF
jgi:hypothetical protein